MSDRGIVTRVRDLVAELRARRAGRKHVSNDINRSARDITGPTGWAHSRSWRRVESDGAAYLKSFDPRIPPSLYISERDRTRHKMPIPVIERCIEDWRTNSDDDPEATEVDTPS